jgi:hypothetical protein
MFSVFGKKPVDAISLPDVPYSVRLNCKDGGIFVGGKEPQHRRSNPDDKIDISIIKVSKYYGNLGLLYTGQWIQLFFVAAPNIDPKILPQNTVCVCYIKKQSISNLFSKVQDVISEQDPGMGIFTIKFNKESGKDGPYYTVAFDWRERQGEPENKQLQQIAGLLQTQPALFDFEGTRDMQCLDGLSSEEITALLEGGQEQPELPPSNVKKIKGGK